MDDRVVTLRLGRAPGTAVRPEVRALLRCRPGAPAARLARGGLVREAAALARAHGRWPDDVHLVHVNDAELAAMRRAWGPPGVNPHTGLPEYSFWSALGDIAGALVQAVPVVGPAVASIAGAGDAPYMGAGLSATPNARGVQARPGGGALGDATLFNIGNTPISFGNALNLGAGIASVIGALNANKKARKRQKQLEQQQQERWDELVGPHVDYSMPSSAVSSTPAPLSQVEYPSNPVGYAGGGRAFPGYRAAGQVSGQGGGQDDLVPAYLSADEYVIPADVVSHLGDGSSNAGARVLDELIGRVRQRRTGNGNFPPSVAGALQRSR